MSSITSTYSGYYDAKTFQQMGIILPENIKTSIETSSRPTYILIQYIANSSLSFNAVRSYYNHNVDKLTANNGNSCRLCLEINKEKVFFFENHEGVEYENHKKEIPFTQTSIESVSCFNFPSKQPAIYAPSELINPTYSGNLLEFDSLRGKAIFKDCDLVIYQNTYSQSLEDQSYYACNVETIENNSIVNNGNFMSFEDIEIKNGDLKIFQRNFNEGFVDSRVFSLIDGAGISFYQPKLLNNGNYLQGNFKVTEGSAYINMFRSKTCSKVQHVYDNRLPQNFCDQGEVCIFENALDIQIKPPSNQGCESSVGV